MLWKARDANKEGNALSSAIFAQEVTVERECQFGHFSQPTHHRTVLRTNSPELIELGRVKRGCAGSPLNREYEAVSRRNLLLLLSDFVNTDYFVVLVTFEVDLQEGEYVPRWKLDLVGQDRPDDTPGVVEIPLWV